MVGRSVFARALVVNLAGGLLSGFGLALAPQPDRLSLPGAPSRLAGITPLPGRTSHSAKG
jgi:hypothetical protein